MCEVVNKHYQEYDVYIGRGSPLGNLMPINDAIGHTREFVIAWYKGWLWKQIKWTTYVRWMVRGWVASASPGPATVT